MLGVSLGQRGHDTEKNMTRYHTHFIPRETSCLPQDSSALDHLVVVKRDVFDSILRHNLHYQALEVYR